MNCNQTRPVVEFEKQELEHSIVTRFERIVTRFPDRLAVKQGEFGLSYEQLNGRANGVAHEILNKCKDSDKSVAFFCDHGFAQIVAMLGILKAGKFYVPLESSFPESINESILKSAKCRLIIHDKKNHVAAQKLAQPNQERIVLEQLSGKKLPGNPDIDISPDDFSCIYYTSGTTGEPKGVIQNHRNVLHFMRTIGSHWPINCSDRMIHLVPCCFSGVMFPIFGPLLNGATIVPCDIREKGMVYLTNLLAEEQITLYFSVPSLFRNVVSAFKKRIDLPHLRLIALGGEAVNRSDIELYKKNFSEQCVLNHLLASAEAYYTRSYMIDKSMDIQQRVIPVGYEVDGKEIKVLDEHGAEVDTGAIGEIAVKSRYLSPGYWQNPELTRSVFLPDPDGVKKRIYLSGDMGRLEADGRLVLLGRKDAMVKIRGQRVEITAIESALLGLDNIKEAAVSSRTDAPDGDLYLAAYIVSHTQPAPEGHTLRAALSTCLPDYMIPAVFIPLDCLPRNANGKVDRPNLPKPEKRRSYTDTPFAPPRNDVESRLAALCEEMFRIHPVGVQDSFEDMGMDSISYLHFLSKLEEQFQQDASIFNRIKSVRTIEQLAQLLNLDETGSLSQEDPMADSFIDNCLSSLGCEDQNRNPQKRHPTMPRFLKEMTFSGITPSYALGIRFISWLCANRWFQIRYLRNRVELARTFLDNINHKSDESTAIRLSLMGNCFKYWLYCRLNKFTPQEVQRWVIVKGLSHVRQSQLANRGTIVLNSHTAIAHAVASILYEAGIETIVFLGGQKMFKKIHTLDDALTVDATGDKDLVSLVPVAKALEKGKVIHIAGDGYRGVNKGFLLPFHGRARRFRTGFAQLALMKDADVIPVFITLQLTGKIVVEFLPSLDVGDESMSRQERLEVLVRQYVDLLDKHWTIHPGNITWAHMNKFLKKPLA